MENEKKLSFEEALNKLQEAVNKLESNDVKLDEAFKLFEDGLAYAKQCEEELTTIEDKVAKVLHDGKFEDLKAE